MLGHKLAQVFAAHNIDTVAAVRGGAANWPNQLAAVKVINSPDAGHVDELARMLDAEQPDVMLNAVGVIKQVIGQAEEVGPAGTIAVNALYPHRLAALCRARGVRLIHFSTDCVFSGSINSQRGPLGYRESDLADARDVYGLSKLLGEPAEPGCVVLRTSIIGRELRGRHSLVEWFLSQGGGAVRGFSRALFTGLPTIVLANVTLMLVQNFPDMEGLWHVGADPISKYDLLSVINRMYNLQTRIVADEDFHCDRRLDSTRFREMTGWRPAPWEEQVAMMHDDQFSYR